MSSSDNIIEAAGVSKTVEVGARPLHILTEVGVSIQRGESIAIVGVSGSGKSTLLGLLAGLDLPSGGVIRVAGNRITDMNEDQRAEVRARHVGFVFQSFQLMPNLTALENVMLPLEILNRADAGDAARAALARVGLEARAIHYPRQLSGGEQQRAALARAFVSVPDILFADEPTGNLDNQTGQRVADLLFAMNDENHTTLVMVTHNLGLADRCRRVFTMDNGNLSEQLRA
ncbi:MAG: ATP-binding cassette domain-containing protein [Gammaproteobacteria bacterium]|nr:ATP-binding cassette domain-containing protein [Gammaproteobacteria bacterium]MDD9874593.1 ATP-binding cassette domain-containing protein [Gammaproteobacteria bacterium]